MTDDKVVALVIVGVLVVLLVSVVLAELTAPKRRRNRAAAAAQRNVVKARLHKRQQRSPQPSSEPPAQATPSAELKDAGHTGDNPAAAHRDAPGTRPAPTSEDPPRQQRIVTRTGPSSSAVLEDPYALYGERAFSRLEDARLIRHYLAGQTIQGIAVSMQLDTKQIASRLIRLIFAAEGSLDTDAESRRAHQRYADWEIDRMREAYAAGVPLQRIAAELERSPLGVGWRLLDLRIPAVPDDVRRRFS